MGKKSKKNKAKGKGNDDHAGRMKARALKRQQQELEAQQELEHDQRNDDVEESDAHHQKLPPYCGRPREFLHGDCVRYYDPKLGHEAPVQRGTIKKGEGDGLSSNQFKFTPFDDSEMTRVVDVKDLYTDVRCTVLRYSEGNIVVCRHQGAIDDKWFKCVVVKVWPRPDDHIDNHTIQTEAYPLYTCNIYGSEFVFQLYEDSDKVIKDINPFPRFDIGEEVLFNSQYVEGIKSANRHLTGGWMKGAIKEINTTGIRSLGGRSKVYGLMGIYLCSFRQNGKLHLCYILDDNDECVTKLTTDPRTRLMDAIEHDCSVDHFTFLVTEFAINVHDFKDLFFHKALECASYNAMLWLEKYMDIKLFENWRFSSIDHMETRDQIDKYMKKIATSQNVARFLREAITWRMDKDQYVGLSNLNHVISGCTNDSCPFISELIQNDRSLELDLALSMNGFGHIFVPWFGRQKSSVLEKFVEVVNSSTSKPMIKYLLKKFLGLTNIYKMKSLIDGMEFKKDNILAKAEKTYFYNSRKFEANWSLKQCMRFYSDVSMMPIALKEKITSLSKTILMIALEGIFELFIMICDEDPNLLYYETATLFMEDDHGLTDFIQEELQEVEPTEESKSMGLLDILIIGDDRGSISGYERENNWWLYKTTLRHFIERGGVMGDDFVKCLKSRIHNKIDTSDEYPLLERRIRLMEDDVDLKGRILILEYLVERHGFPYPSPITAIRYRKGGILRWLLEKRKVFLIDDRPEKHESLMSYVKDVLIEHQIATEYSLFQSVGFLLCFACVHFDDIQSLIWLMSTYQGEIEIETKGRELNLVHVAAYYGRIEIVHYFRSTLCCKSLLSRSVGVGAFGGMYSSHIAMSRGHVWIADLLMNKCPQVDLNNTSLIDYAKTSEYEFVREWGDRKIQTLQFLKNIEEVPTFLDLIRRNQKSENEFKRFLTETSCMHPEKWEAQFGDIGDQTCVPTKLALFQKLVGDCLEGMSMDFSMWLYCEIFANDITLSSYYTSEAAKQGKKLVGLDQVNISDDYQISEWLTKSWAAKISHSHENNAIIDPLDYLRLVSAELKQKLLRRFMKISILEQLRAAGLKEVESLILTAHSSDDLIETGGDVKDISCKLCSLNQSNLEHEEYKIMLVSGKINMKAMIRHEPQHSFNEFFLGPYLYRRKQYNRLNLVLPLYSHDLIIEYCIDNRHNLDSNMEFEMIYLSSYLNRKNVLDIFLREDASFNMSTRDRNWVAALGSAERGDILETKSYLQVLGETFLDPIIEDFETIKNDSQGFSLHDCLTKDKEEMISFHNGPIASLSLFLIYGFLKRLGGSTSTSTNNIHFEYSRIASINNYHLKHIMLASRCVLDTFHEGYSIIVEGFLKVLECLKCYEIGTIEFQLIFGCFEKILQRISRIYRDGDSDMRIPALKKCLTLAIKLGIDIKKLNEKSWGGDAETEDTIQKFIAQQKQICHQFDRIRDEKLTAELEKCIQSVAFDLKACNKDGLFVAHLAASYDRVDILEFLEVQFVDSLYQLDRKGRLPVDIAKSSKAKNTTQWFQKRHASTAITNFVQSHHLRKEAQRKYQINLRGFTRLQATYRGFKSRKKIRPYFQETVEMSRKFHFIWQGCLDLVKRSSESTSRCTWLSIQESLYDYGRTMEIDDEIVESMERIDDAMTNATIIDIAITDDSHEENSIFTGQDSQYEQEVKEAENENDMIVNIQYTNHVAKWLKQAGELYRSFFVRRMRQLAQGQRSRILAKRLKGSKHPIYETYLEQKSGFRILWTEVEADLLVWYVAKHDNVSRLMSRIDEAFCRTNRQMISVEPLLSDNRNDTTTTNTATKNILLDPFSNIPLKVYEMPIDDITDVAKEDWVPILKLTEEEKDVVESKGSVLLLGRSGTGKTVCICNRMDYDRRQYAYNATFTQLFVARSLRLCSFVSDTIGATDTTTFTVFDSLVDQLKRILPPTQQTNRPFLRTNRMTFSRFKKDVYGGDRGIDPLLVWTCIRSFIKGSIEAALNENNAISRDDFRSFDVFGMKRCRLTLEQRDAVYCIYEKYERTMIDLQLYDDCDVIMSLIHSLQACKTSDPDFFFENVRKSKVYVDEVQDYTQAEILLFFYISGPGNLFFAGDPAQSVVEGVEFRFEDIRSVEYQMSQGQDDLILQKPKIVNINFRSHSGVLNTAAAILSCMFGAFPHSAKQLKEDYGLFSGPRPAVCYKVGYDKLSSLMKEELNGVVVLVHDACVSRSKRLLDGYPLVYGIREAKGLEFKKVMILNFFADLPDNIQKPWRELLLGRFDEGYQNNHPEIEGLLKLLYTGVTRCIDKLLFIECTTSLSGDAFVRWLTTTSVKSRTLTTRNKVPLASKITDVKGMAMTKDEWISSGFENAIGGEEIAGDDPSSAKLYFEKAVYCFQQAKENELTSKARVHLSSVVLRAEIDNALIASTKEYQDKEIEASGVMERLFKEKLVFEAENLFQSLLPLLADYSRAQLSTMMDNVLKQSSKSLH